MTLDQPGEATQPVPTASETQAIRRPSRRRRILLAVLIYIVAMVIVGGSAIVLGQNQGESTRRQQIDQLITEQFAIGLVDLEQGRYDLAVERFEAIIRLSPEFPDAEATLVRAYVLANNQRPQIPVEPTSTPDPSPPDQLLEQAQAAFAAGDWTTTINKLSALRAKDSEFESIEVDRLFYLSLRNRGMELIAQGLMEEGLYDLSRAESFGPLDIDAIYRRDLARLYLQANSYLGVNWFQAAEAFFELCQAGATTDSCLKYAESAWEYANLLVEADDPCQALDYYAASLEQVPNETLLPTAEHIERVCQTATAPPPAPPATETPTPPLTPTPE
ncbi:MAG: hypothetical protein PVF49_13510 [Anaerolineales bacterium]